MRGVNRNAEWTAAVAKPSRSTQRLSGIEPAFEFLTLDALRLGFVTPSSDGVDQAPSGFLLLEARRGALKLGKKAVPDKTVTLTINPTLKQ